MKKSIRAKLIYEVGTIEKRGDSFGVGGESWRFTRIETLHIRPITNDRIKVEERDFGIDKIIIPCQHPSVHGVDMEIYLTGIYWEEHQKGEDAYESLSHHSKNTMRQLFRDGWKEDGGWTPPDAREEL